MSIKSNIISFTFFSLLAMSGSFTLASSVHAAPSAPQPVQDQNITIPPSTGESGGQTIANPLKFATLDQLFLAILDAIVYLGTIALTFAFVFLGFQYVNARGNPGQISKLHKSFLYTILGGLILLGAKGIGLMIAATVNNITN